MEGLQESLWRRDAVWAIIVIVAAISFGVEGVARVREQLTAPPVEGGLDDTETLKELSRAVTVVFAAGTVVLFLYAGAAIAGLKLFRPAPMEPVTWNLWDVARAAAVAYLGTAAIVSIALTASGLLGPKAPEPAEPAAWAVITQMLALHVAILALPLGFVRARGASIKAMGLTGRKWLSSLLHGVLGYVGALPLFWVAVMITVWILSAFGIGPSPNMVEPTLKASEGTWIWWVVVFIATVFGPFTEEVFFRGFMLPAMRRRLSPAPAILINGALFALIHVSVRDFLPIFVLGAAMAFLFERTRSIVSCTAFHVLHNGAQIAIYYLLPR